ncbi:hypothetical protein Peur_072225 [Populus x canadensis]
MANGWVVREAELTVGGWFEDGDCCVRLVVCEDLEMGLGLNGRRGKCAIGLLAERDEPVNGVMVKGGSLWPWVEKK